eukprot:scaffold23202_cov118-Isochrysis_galbana.AAC.3
MTQVRDRRSQSYMQGEQNECEQLNVHGRTRSSAQMQHWSSSIIKSWALPGPSDGMLRILARPELRAPYNAIDKLSLRPSHAKDNSSALTEWNLRFGRLDLAGAVHVASIERGIVQHRHTALYSQRGMRTTDQGRKAARVQNNVALRITPDFELAVDGNRTHCRGPVRAWLQLRIES